jgi:hypothetical protein
MSNRATGIDIEPLVSAENEQPQRPNEPANIKIKFTRYGLVKESELGHEQYHFGNFPPMERTNILPPGAPAIPGYSYCKNPVRDGYLYVYNETTDLWFEYKITDQRLQAIEWTNFQRTNNERKPRLGTQRGDTIPAKENETLWVAYSDTQWSAAYALSNFGRNSENREKRFERIQVKGFLNALGFQEKDNRLKQRGNEIFSKKSAQESTPSGNTTGSDFIVLTKDASERIATLHITLHDPIGAAEDICVDAGEKYNEFQSLINSIQTGAEKPEELSEEALTQAQALHTHALMFYKIFYDQARSENQTVRRNETAEEKKARDAQEKFLKMSKHLVSDKFLEKMLGKEERAKLRDEINTYRESLLTFVDSDYYNAVLDDYCRNTPTRRELGIHTVLEHIQRFAYDPSLADQAMDNVHTESPVSQTVKEYLEKVYNDTAHPINRLFAKDFDIQDMINDYDNRQTIDSRKLRNIDSNSTFVEDFVAEVDFLWANMFTIFTVWQDYITAMPQTKAYITEVPGKWFDVTIRSQSINNGAKQYLWAINPELDLGEELRKMNASLPDDHPVRLRGRGANGRSGIPAAPEQQPLLAATKGKKIAGTELNPKITVIKDNPTVQRFNLIAKIFNSRGFLCFSGMLSVGNLMVAVKKRDNKNPFTIAGSAVTITAAVAEIGFYLVYYAEMHAKVKIVAFGRLYISPNLVTGIAVTALGVANMIQGVNSISKGDVDAGIAYIVGGAFLITGLILSLKAIIPMKIVALPATIAYAIGVGILILAVYLTDTPIEEFFKNCILNKRAMNRVIANWDSLSAKEIHTQLLEKKADIVNTQNFREWLDMETSIQQLMEFFAALEIDTEKSISNSVVGTTVIVTTLIDKVTVFLNPSHLTFNTDFDGGLWIYTQDRKVVKISVDDDAMEKRKKGVEITFRETEKGVEIVFDFQDKLKAVDIARMYFYYHLVLSDGTIFPSYNADEHYIQMVYRHSSRAITTPLFLDKLIGDLLDYSDYCDKKDRRVYSLEKLETLIK